MPKLITQKQLGDLSYSSGFVFTGEIMALDTSLYELPQYQDYAVVKIKTAYRAPKGYNYIAGKNVTVKLSGKSPASNLAGDSLLFFASGMYFGKTIGLEAKEIIRWKDYPESFNDSLKIIFNEAFNRDLRSRLQMSDSIFKGVVIEIIAADTASSVVNEGEFEWATAKVKVLQIFKGNLQQDSIVLIDFAAKRDMEFHFSPYLTANETGIFILNKNESIPFGKTRAVAINRMDFYKPENEELIMGLLLEINK